MAVQGKGASFWRAIVTVAAGVANAAAAQTAQAQSPAAEEIVVTAQKREQSIQDVPLAVSALWQ